MDKTAVLFWEPEEGCWILSIYNGEPVFAINGAVLGCSEDVEEVVSFIDIPRESTYSARLAAERFLISKKYKTRCNVYTYTHLVTIGAPG